MTGLDLQKERNNIDLTQTELAEKLNISRETVQNWEKKGVPKSKIGKVEVFFGVKKRNDSELINPNPILTSNTNIKVPYYDIDATAHIATSFNDVKESPAFYVDYPPFNDCSAYINCFGDSMFPKYKNGERLAVKQIRNFDIILWGETYLVVTDSEANDLRTVKDVFAHDDSDKIVLRSSNPTYKGDTVINKKNILSMFAVKGKISQNFN